MKTKISAIEGNSQYLDGGAMFGNVPRVLWEKWHPTDELGRIELATRGLLIEYGGELILCETGIGNFFSPKLAERYGVMDTEENRLLRSLRKLGVEPADVNYVILSHLHFDHAGGILKKDGELNFPRATYLVGKEAFARSCHPHPRDRASFIAGLTDKLVASKRLQIVDNEKIAGLFEDRLQFIFTFGHTVGQMHTLWRGDEKTVFFAGDLIPGCAWIHLPITMGYDRFAEQVIDEKEKLYERVVAEEWLLFLMHDAKIKATQIENKDGKFVSVNSHDTLVNFQI